MSQKAMTFVGGGAKNFTGWFAFLGLVKDKRFPKTGSPFQMNFPGGLYTYGPHVHAVDLVHTFTCHPHAICSV